MAEDDLGDKVGVVGGAAGGRSAVPAGPPGAGGAEASGAPGAGGVEPSDAGEAEGHLRTGPSLLLVLGALVLGTVGAAVLGGIGVVLDGGGTDGPGLLAGSFVGQWIVWVGAAFLASRAFGTGSVRRDLHWRFDRRDVLLGVVVAIAGLVATVTVQQLLAAISSDLIGSNTSFVEDQAKSALGSVVVGLSTMVGAPLVEELFFRGLLQQALARFRWVALVVQGLVFGSLHLTPAEGLGNVGIIAGLAVLGMVFGYAAQRTGRLGTAVIGHAIFNAVAVVPILLR